MKFHFKHEVVDSNHAGNISFWAYVFYHQILLYDCMLLSRACIFFLLGEGKLTLFTDLDSWLFVRQQHPALMFNTSVV